MSPTPGMKTSEFLLTVLAMICTLVLALAGEIAGDQALAAITGAAGVYTLSRGIAKKGQADDYVGR